MMTCCWLNGLVDPMSCKMMTWVVDHMKPLSWFGLNGFKWWYWLSGFAKVDPILWSESGTCFILYGGYGLALIWSTIEHYNRLLLCGLNPGIFPIFEPFLFASRVLLFLNLESIYFFHLFRNHLFEIKLEFTRTKSTILFWTLVPRGFALSQ